MLRSAMIVVPVTVVVGALAVTALQRGLPIGPVVLLLGAIPIAVLVVAGRRLSTAIPDLVFGSIDTGLLVVPALWGGITFGVAGAIAGGVVGDALSDSIAGLFEGHVAEWLRSRGFEESREAVTTALGKMAGCLLGSGLVLSVALLFGISLDAV